MTKSDISGHRSYPEQKAVLFHGPTTMPPSTAEAQTNRNHVVFLENFEDRIAKAPGRSQLTS